MNDLIQPAVGQLFYRFLQVLKLKSLAQILFVGVLFANTTVLLAQIPEPGRRQRPADQFQRFGDDDFPNLLGEDAGPDTLKIDEKGRVLLEPVPPDIYGPWSSGYIYEQDWFENSNRVRLLDSTLNSMQRYNFVAQRNFKLQDLGTLGTASKDLFFREPDRMGTRLGLYALTPYYLEADQIEYRNTLSPYSRWYYVQGGAGRTLLDIVFSRNVNPRWNVSIVFRRVNSRLLVGNATANRNDRQVSSENYVLSTRYSTPDKRYRLLAHVSSFRHRMAETGGLVLEDSTLLDSFIPPPDFIRQSGSFERVEDLFRLAPGRLANRLSGVESTTRKLQSHIYHEYHLAGRATNVQVFHRFNRTTQTYEFTDARINTNINSGVYPNGFFPGIDTAAHAMRFQELDNKIGLKGNLEKLFYAFYLGNRNYGHQFEFLRGQQVPRPLPAQPYAGFMGIYSLTPTTVFRGTYETLLGRNNLGSMVTASFEIPYFKVTHHRVSAEPDLIQQYYFGYFFQWNNTEQVANPFSNMQFASTRAQLDIRIPRLLFQPYVKLTEFNRYIFYNTVAEPEQFNERINLIQAGFDFHKQMGKFHHKIYGLYTLNNHEEVIRMPELFGNYQVYLETPLFNNAIDIQIGFDFHYHSRFFADAYMPVTQQFHLQNDVRIGGYLLADLFLSFHMKKANMFFKMANVNQGLLQEGYFITPLYMGQARQFEFGVSWLFFD